MKDEFSIIKTYFQSIAQAGDDVVLGIGDDAACVNVPPDKQLVITTDTLLVNVHFPDTWDAYAVASRAVRANVSDLAAMGAEPHWALLSLTMPDVDERWLERFSQGLRDSFDHYHISLIGGDTNRGPLSITIIMHGFIPKSQLVTRSGAKPGDIIYVSGALGAVGLAVHCLKNNENIVLEDQKQLERLFQCPNPRMDFVPILQQYATAAIDISDGLSADLNHICTSSHVGACIDLQTVPIHPLVLRYKKNEALDLALYGGEDYELCFTVSPEKQALLEESLNKDGLECYPIGHIENEPGIRVKLTNGRIKPHEPKGYRHF